MENVIREDLDQLNALLTVHVPSSSYKPKFENKIRDFRRKAQIKGFRKGHTPETLVRKMYGEAILAEVVQEEINRRLQEYLEAEKPHFFGEPLLSEEQEALRFDISEMPDYKVRFELGLIPDFQLHGLGASTSVPLPRVRVSEKEIDEHIAMLRRRHGEREEIAEGLVQDMDQVEMHLEEWENDQKKEGGVHTHTNFLINEQMVDELRAKLLGKTIKDTIRFDPYQAEKNADEATVRKYILHLEEDAPDTSRDFLGRIDKIVRVTPAEMDQAFYEKAFGPGQVADETALRELVRGQLEQSFAEPVREFIQVLMKVSLLEANAVPLPESFLRRWVTTRAQEDNETEDWDDEKLRRFYLDLRWSLIRDKVLEIGQVEVTDQDILEEYKKKLREYFGGNADEALLDQLAPRALGDKEFRGKLTDQVLRDKLAGVYLEQVSLVQDEIAPDDFRTWMEQAYQEVEKRFLAL